MASNSIAIVGSGPMANYLLKHLSETGANLDITIFEADAIAGTGMPYRSGMNADYMLSNIFSREFPALTTTFADWLRG